VPWGTGLVVTSTLNGAKSAQQGGVVLDASNEAGGSESPTTAGVSCSYDHATISRFAAHLTDNK
jgi:hypothetical protein